MPTYQYLCTECGRDLEVVQKFSDPSLTECPECQGALRKVYNAVGVVFKGSGFYRTDSRSSSSTDKAAPSAKSDSSSSKSDSSKSDSASGSKSDSSKSTGSSGGSSSTSSTKVAAGASSTS